MFFHFSVTVLLTKDQDPDPAFDPYTNFSDPDLKSQQTYGGYGGAGSIIKTFCTRFLTKTILKNYFGYKKPWLLCSHLCCSIFFGLTGQIFVCIVLHSLLKTIPIPIRATNNMLLCKIRPAYQHTT
jgi:hypothetical protein